MNHFRPFAFLSLITFVALPGYSSKLYPQEEGDDVIKSLYGGYVAEPGTGSGNIHVYNAQKLVPFPMLEKAFGEFCSDIYHYEFKVVDECPPNGVRVELVEGNGNDAIIFYPDSCRTVIDLIALNKDRPNVELLAQRTRKEMLRAFAFLAGAASFAEPGGTLADAMISLERLDAAKEELPPELPIRFADYSERSGVKPWFRITYKDACDAGIAEKPANGYQKKIWDAHKNKTADKADPTNRWKRDFKKK